MFIKVTNMFPERKGDPLYINTRHIVVVYEDHEPGGSLATKIHAHQLTWHVEESYGEVVKMIEESSKS